MREHWSFIKQNMYTLLRSLRLVGSQRGLARVLDIDHKAISYWLDQYGFETEDYQGFEPIGEESFVRMLKHGYIPDNTKPDDLKEGYTEQPNKAEEFKKEMQDQAINPEDVFVLDDYLEQETNSKYRIEGDTYIFDTKFGEKPVPKKKLDEFLQLYCEQDLTVNQTGNELEYTRQEVYDIKKALGITHDSVPFLEEDIETMTSDEMSDITVQRKKKNYYKKVKQKELDQAIKENKKFREKDYFFRTYVQDVIKMIEPIEFRTPYLYEMGKEEDKPYTLVVNITDWHKGKLVYNSEILGNNSYNKNIYQERIKAYLEDTLRKIEQYEPEQVVILNYGDGPDSPGANVYPGQRDNQDVTYEKQFVGYTVDLKNFIMAIYDYQPNIFYASVPGNHSEGAFNWDVAANQMLEVLLEEYETIKIDARDKMFKTIDIYDYYIVMSHGDKLSKRVSTPTAQKEALSIITLEGLPIKNTYICQGHLHHRADEGPSYRRMMLPSMVGGDQLSANMMQTGARPAQELFLFKENEGMIAEYYTFFD